MIFALNILGILMSFLGEGSQCDDNRCFCFCFFFLFCPRCLCALSPSYWFHLFIYISGGKLWTSDWYFIQKINNLPRTDSVNVLWPNQFKQWARPSAFSNRRTTFHIPETGSQVSSTSLPSSDSLFGLFWYLNLIRLLILHFAWPYYLIVLLCQPRPSWLADFSGIVPWHVFYTVK